MRAKTGKDLFDGFVQWSNKVKMQSQQPLQKKSAFANAILDERDEINYR